MLTKSDIRGVCAFVPTPVANGATAGDLTSSIDLDATIGMVDRLIDDGVHMLALGGTTGEGAALLWEEKREFVAAVVERAAGRIPIFAGAIALGTRETIRQMREYEKLGVGGAIICPPFWQSPTLENAVGFVEDVSQAVPDLPTMIYSNKFFFKFEFPTEFWRRVASDSSTVIATKVSYDFQPEDYQVAGERIQFMGGEGNFRAVHDALGTQATAAWCTSAAMGPEPWLALVEAVGEGDTDRVEAVLSDIESVPPPASHGRVPSLLELQRPARKGSHQRGGLHAMWRRPSALHRSSREMGRGREEERRSLGEALRTVSGPGVTGHAVVRLDGFEGGRVTCE